MLQTVHRFVHIGRRIFPAQLLAHVGVHHSHDTVQQNFHLPGNAKEEQWETPNDHVGFFELFAGLRNIVAFNETATVWATPAGEASTARLDV